MIAYRRRMASGLRAAALLAVSVVIVSSIGVPAVAAPRPTTNDRYSATEDRELRVKAPGVLKNDRVRRSVRNLSVVKQPGHGTVTLRKNGSFRYDPNRNWSGTDSFTYRVVDTRGRRSTARATIVVAPVDDPTVIRPDGTTLYEDHLVVGNILSNDIDVDSKLTVAGHDASNAHGAFTIEPDGDWTYLPTLNWNGTATVRYTTNTGATGTYKFIVLPDDDATNGASDAATTDEDEVVSGNVLANDVDVDSVLTVTDHYYPDPHGEFTIQADGDWAFTPDADWNGTTSVRYSTNTGSMNWLTIAVTPVADPTTVVDDVAEIAEDGSASGNVLANDSDPDSTLGISQVDTHEPHGMFGMDPGTGAWTYEPDDNWSGTATIDYTTTTGATGTLTITVTPVDDSSELGPDTETVDEDLDAVGNVLANDSDVDDELAVTTFFVAGEEYDAGDTAALPGVGTLAIAGNGAYTFDPVANWNGPVPIVAYSTNTGWQETLQITVTAVNDAPVTTSTFIDVPAHVTLSETSVSWVLTHVTDVDGDSLSMTGVVGLVNGTATLVAGGTKIEVTRGVGAELYTQVNYTVSDGHGGTATGALFLNYVL